MARGWVDCVQCSKKRIIYGSKKLNKKEQEMLNDVLDSIDFTCGDKLLPNEKRYDLLKNKKISVDRRKTCKKPVETYYYKVFTQRLICSICNRSLENTLVDLYKQRLTEFSSVVPCCKRTNCIENAKRWQCGPYPGWSCKRPKLVPAKKKAQKRKASHDEAENNRKKKQRI